MTSSFTALALAPGVLNTGNAPRGHLRNGDVVDARTGAADGLEALRDVTAVHVRRAQQDEVRILDVVADLIRAAGQA